MYPCHKPPGLEAPSPLLDKAGPSTSLPPVKRRGRENGGEALSRQRLVFEAPAHERGSAWTQPQSSSLDHARPRFDGHYVKATAHQRNGELTSTATHLQHGISLSQPRHLAGGIDVLLRIRRATFVVGVGHEVIVVRPSSNSLLCR